MGFPSPLSAVVWSKGITKSTCGTKECVDKRTSDSFPADEGKCVALTSSSSEEVFVESEEVALLRAGLCVSLLVMRGTCKASRVRVK